MIHMHGGNCGNAPLNMNRGNFYCKSIHLHCWMGKNP